MINRSYKTLLTQLANSFCKNKNLGGGLFQSHKQSKNGKKQTTKDQQSNNTQAATKNVDGEASQLSNNKNESRNSGSQKQRNHQRNQESSKHENKIRQNNKNSKESQTSQKFKPRAFQLQENKNFELLRSNFDQLYHNNKLEGQLKHELSNQNFSELRSYLQLYLQRDFESSLRFIEKQLLSHQNSNEEINEMKSLPLVYAIREEKFAEFHSFLNSIEKKEMRQSLFSHSSSAQIFEILVEANESPEKYAILKQLLNSVNIQNPEMRSQVSDSLRRLIHRFSNSNSAHDQSSSQAFLKILKIAKKRSVLPQDFVKKVEIFRAIQPIFFGKCSNKSLYKDLFELVNKQQNKKSSKIETQKFYRDFQNLIHDYQLKSTQTAQIPLPVNSQLISSYNSFAENKNVLGALACLAISLQNRYLSIPLNFLQEQLPKLESDLSETLVNKIKNDINLLGISYYTKNSESENAQKLIEQFFDSSSNPSLQLRAAIANKNYQSAVSIFTQTYLKPLSIKKERKIISKALYIFFTEHRREIVHDRDLKNVQDKVEDFVKNLSDEYIWESWRKREDIGYLYEDFYIQDPSADPQQGKEDSRFSFWENLFSHKRLIEINKFEQLGELKNLKEANEHPYIDTHFNLNQYLAPGNYEEYRRRADHDDHKHIEMMLYLLKAEEAILEYESTNDSKVAVRVLQFQNTMCEDNLNILEEFGLKDYDLTQYDLQEYANRLEFYKKTKGVKRYKTKSGLYLEFDKSQITRLEQALEMIQNDKKEEIKRANQQRKKALEAQQEGEQNEGEQVQGQAAEETQAQQVQAESVEEAQEGSQAEVEAGEETEAVEAGQSTEEYGEQSDHICVTHPRQELVEVENPLQLLTVQYLDRLRIRNVEIFNVMGVQVRLEPTKLVQQLIKWGLLNKQPMAIYMGEKLAAQTRQMIPHNLAIRVSDMFSHYREMSEELFAECKVCLSHIGKIERELIYDSNKKYQHVTYKPLLDIMNAHIEKHLRSRIDDLTGVNPNLKDTNLEPRELLKRASKGPAF